MASSGNERPVREKLKPHEGKRIEVRAVFGHWGRDCDLHSYGKPILLLQDPTHQGDLIDSHCWIKHVDHLHGLDLQPGDDIRFLARVNRYKRKSDQRFSWSLDGNSIQEIFVIRNGRLQKAERLPLPKPTTPKPQTEEPMMTQQYLDDSIPRKSKTATEKVKTVKEARDRLGGWDALELALSVVPSLLTELGEQEVRELVGAMK